MSSKQSLKNFFKNTYPIFSIFIYMITITVTFDTFNMEFFSALYNILISFPIFGIVLMITRRFHVATLISAITAFFIFYIDQYVFSARLTHIRFSDIRLLRHAARVANRYPLVWNMEIARRLLIVIVLIAFMFFIGHYYKLKYSWKVGFVAGFCIFVLSSIILLLGVIPVRGQEGFDFSEDAEQSGLLYSWYCQIQRGRMDAPDGYSKQKAEEILNKYEKTQGDNDVRVIVIMNESFADYSLLGDTRFKDPLPYIHSLVEKKEAFEGKLAVNVFAGGTANTEFEFLTGYSTAFLPKDCVPYLQYVNHSMNSIVSDIGEKNKIAVHPYYSEEWNRSQVYKFLDFDRFISGSDFGSQVEVNGKSATSKPSENIVSFGDGPLYVRGLISDKTCFERIIKEDAYFTFAVTMQNHGSYDYNGDDFKNIEYVTADDRLEWKGRNNLVGMLYGVETGKLEDELYRVNQYLTLSNLSDQAFKELIENLKKDERKTIVLMFGDHQPGVLIAEHYVENTDKYDLDYTVPYIFWTNFETELTLPDYISVNYLSAVLKKNAGMALTEWDQFRLEKMEKYPVLTNDYILDKNGNRVDKDTFEDYENIQYMRMFG